jgi:hypothetical protein
MVVGNVGLGFRLLQSISDRSKNNNSLTVGAPSLQQSPNGGSLDDQILALQMAAIDARYGGDGGASSAAASYHPGVAPKLDQYSGPTIDQLNQYTSTGAGNIEQGYGNLANYIQSQLPERQSIQQQSGAAQQSAYSQAAQNIQNAVSKGQGVLATPATSAGAAAAKDQQAAVAAILDRYKNVNAQHQWNAAVANNAQQALQTSNTGLRTTGAKDAGAQALFRFVAGTNLQKSQAQLQMDQIAASNKAKTDQYNQQENAKKQAIMDRVAAQQAGNAGKAQAAKLELLAKVLGTEGKAGKSLTGVQGVLAFGNQQGNPDAANKFLSLIAQARGDAERQNEAAAKDASGQTKKTTAAEQLQMLMSGTAPDINDTQSMIDLVRNSPELSSLQKYAIWAPQQLYGNMDLLNQLSPGLSDTWKSTVQQASKLGYSQSKMQDMLNQSIAKSFKPMFNMSGLKANANDYRTLQNYLAQQSNANDLYNQMFEIYSGKWGSGG